MGRIFQLYIEQNSIQLYSSNSVVSKCPSYRFETMCLIRDITLLGMRLDNKYNFESKFDFEYKSRPTNIFFYIILISFQKRTFPHECYQLRCDHNVTSTLGPSSPIPQSQFELPNAPGVQLTSKSCVEQGRCSSLSLDLSTPLPACMCSVGQTNKLPPQQVNNLFLRPLL